jgi:hypothetical protein
MGTSIEEKGFGIWFPAPVAEEIIGGGAEEPRGWGKMVRGDLTNSAGATVVRK